MLDFVLFYATFKVAFRKKAILFVFLSTVI